MPPTVMVPWFTPCCGLWVLLVCAAAGLPAALVFAPELVFPPPEALWLRGAAVRLASWVPPDVLPPLLAGGAAVPEVAPLLGVAAPELPGDVYACPATAAVAGCAAVALPPRCAKSYAIAPPKARVAMTFTVMKMIATRSRMGRLP